jgi:uncharacterized membrane-anchored protein
MKNPKIVQKMFLLIILILVQILVPGYMVYRHYDTLKTGEAFNFVVRPYDPYDPFRGRYVALRPVERTYQTYVILWRDQDGYAEIAPIKINSPSEVHPGSAYVKDLQLTRYYMNENMAPTAERIQRELSDDDVMYLQVMVKNGHYVIEGLYLNGIPIEQYISSGE